MPFINCHHLKLLISSMFSFRFCLLYGKQDSVGTVCEESSTMMQFNPPEIWKWHAMLHGIHTKTSKTRL